MCLVLWRGWLEGWLSWSDQRQAPSPEWVQQLRAPRVSVPSFRHRSVSSRTFHWPHAPGRAWTQEERAGLLLCGRSSKGHVHLYWVPTPSFRRLSVGCGRLFSVWPCGGWVTEDERCCLVLYNRVMTFKSHPHACLPNAALTPAFSHTDGLRVSIIGHRLPKWPRSGSW